MGSPETAAGRDADEGPQHKVAVSPFWMAKTEVTWDEYEEFYFGMNPEGLASDVQTSVDAVSRPTPPYGAPDLGWGAGKRPAMSMTFFAATKYCEWLSTLTGKKYRLPTSAEWEYACRAGTQTSYFFGDDASQLGEYAWYKDNSSAKSYEAAAKKPNPWGLLDMLGNVSEFCNDFYSAEDYKRFPPEGCPKDPQGPEEGKEHVIRGGSYREEAKEMRSAARQHTTEEGCLVTDPNFPKSKWWYSDCFHTGFRVVRSSE